MCAPTASMFAVLQPLLTSCNILCRACHVVHAGLRRAGGVSQVLYNCRPATNILHVPNQQRSHFIRVSPAAQVAFGRDTHGIDSIAMLLRHDKPLC